MQGLGLQLEVSSGHYYYGCWDNNKPSGPGRLFTSAALYEGLMDKGLPHGEGVLTDAKSGTITKGVWRQGKLEGKTMITETGGSSVIQDMGMIDQIERMISEESGK